MCFSNVWALSEGVIKSKKANSMDHFLNGYIQHDLGLQEAKIAVAKAELTLEQTNIESGLNVSLSTGNSSVLCNNELSFISHPSLDVSLPTKNNTSVTLSLPTKVVVGSKKTLASVEKAGVSIGRDIFSGKDTRANLAIEKAAHGLIEAK
ncbi:MAG TPA: hypothetical protein VFC68_04500, partial [Treponemataceae bacterium]|nr:hypothetical protein [Treponemataceae bacterium]